MDSTITGASLFKPSGILEWIGRKLDRWFHKEKESTVRRFFRNGKDRIVWERSIDRHRTMTLTRFVYMPDGDRMRVVKQTFVLRPVNCSR